MHEHLPGDHCHQTPIKSHQNPIRPPSKVIAFFLHRGSSKVIKSHQKSSKVITRAEHRASR
eukprot:9478943-Pyramimonas_sp.AAC.1